MQNLLSRAEARLSETWNAPVRLGAPALLEERDHIARLEVLQASGGAPASVILKSFRVFSPGETYDHQNPDLHSPAGRLLGEWASLQFLGLRYGADPLAPRLYAGDLEAGFFLMEDLGQGAQPHHLLMGGDPQAAAEILSQISRRLGEMHALTSGRQAEFLALRRKLGPFHYNPRQEYTRLAASAEAGLSALGYSLDARCQAEIASVIGLLVEPGPFSAFIHCDPCLDNWMGISPPLRLFDYENSRYGLALLEGLYPRFPFPTCWCAGSIPQAIWRKAEETYRSALVRGVPQAEDDRLFGQAAAAACAFWMLLAFGESWHPITRTLEEDRMWGIASLRQRVLARLEGLHLASQEFSCLPALGGLSRKLLDDLRLRWPNQAGGMNSYPAFASQDASQD